jgi:hypothetical protein
MNTTPPYPWTIELEFLRTWKMRSLGLQWPAQTPSK